MDTPIEGYGHFLMGKNVSKQVCLLAWTGPLPVAKMISVAGHQRETHVAIAILLDPIVPANDFAGPSGHLPVLSQLFGLRSRSLPAPRFLAWHSSHFSDSCGIQLSDAEIHAPAAATRCR